MVGHGILVLGVGDAHARDGGVGLHIVRALEEAGITLPPGTRLHACACPCADILPLLGDAAALVLVDAANLDAEPGTVAVHRDPTVVADFAFRLLPGPDGHRCTEDNVRIMRALPRKLAFVGVQPARSESGSDLSDRLGSRLPIALEAVVDEAWRLAPDVPMGAETPAP